MFLRRKYANSGKNSFSFCWHQLVELKSMNWSMTHIFRALILTWMSFLTWTLSQPNANSFLWVDYLFDIILTTCQSIIDWIINVKTFVPWMFHNPVSVGQSTAKPLPSVDGQDNNVFGRDDRSTEHSVRHHAPFTVHICNSCPRFCQNVTYIRAIFCTETCKNQVNDQSVSWNGSNAYWHNIQRFMGRGKFRLL